MVVLTAYLASLGAEVVALQASCWVVEEEDHERTYDDLYYQAFSARDEGDVPAYDQHQDQVLALATYAY